MRKLKIGGACPPNCSIRSPVTRTLSAPAKYPTMMLKNDRPVELNLVKEEPNTGILFTPACLAEANWVKTNMVSNKPLLIKLKEELNDMIIKLKNFIETINPELSEEQVCSIFLSDNVRYHIGDIGTADAKSKFKYLVRNPVENADDPTCRQKITALHNFVYSTVGAKTMINLILFPEEYGIEPNKYMKARKEQIYDIFKLNTITKDMLNDNFYLRISWSPTDYLFPSLALRRTVISDIRYKKMQNLKNVISNAKSTKNNIKKMSNKNYQGTRKCKYSFDILNEPLTEMEKKLIREQLKISVNTEITTNNYPFKIGACYDTKTITKNPKNKLNIAAGKCRVVGFSGSAALLLDTALILGLDWRPLYLSLIVDYVPIHHSIGEIFDALIDMGFINKEEYNNKERTIIRDIGEVLKLETFNYNYSNQLNYIRYGFKLRKNNTRKNNTKKQSN
jgi:hypothetical protein